MELAREKANHENNMVYAAKDKPDLEVKITSLKEEHRRPIAEGNKFNKSFENANKFVHGFVGKALEKARDSFAEGFCLAQKKILD